METKKRIQMGRGKEKTRVDRDASTNWVRGASGSKEGGGVKKIYEITGTGSRKALLSERAKVKPCLKSFCQYTQTSERKKNPKHDQVARTEGVQAREEGRSGRRNGPPVA